MRQRLKAVFFRCRIKVNATEPQWGGGSLLLAVEVRTAAAGHYAEPLQLRLSSRGTEDPPDSVSGLSVELAL